MPITKRPVAEGATAAPAPPAPKDKLHPRDTRRSLPIALLRAREAVMARFRPILAAHGVTEPQWRVVRALDEHGTLEATELARQASVLGPSLSRILRTLEARGLVERGRSDCDGRRAMLSLTPAGGALIRAMLPDSVRVYGEIEAILGRERIDEVLDLLGEIADCIDPPRRP